MLAVAGLVYNAGTGALAVGGGGGGGNWQGNCTLAGTANSWRWWWSVRLNWWQLAAQASSSFHTQAQHNYLVVALLPNQAVTSFTHSHLLAHLALCHL
jgi:hypothetical protein